MHVVVVEGVFLWSCEGNSQVENSVTRAVVRTICWEVSCIRREILWQHRAEAHS